jgi:hypothetical protein
VRFFRKDEIDLHRALEHEHPAVFRAQPIPLLRERFQRLEQAWERIGDRAEVACDHPEVPVGSLVRAAFRSGPDQLDILHARVISHESDHTLG